ncbi:hypothetical protein PanWU01x14_016620, partial [Parasponia andersonii]
PVGCRRPEINPSQILDRFGSILFLPLQLGVRSFEGLPPEDHWRQHTALDPDRALNVILGRCAHWADCPKRMTLYQNLAPARLEP